MTTNNYTHREEIESFVWCVMASNHIPIDLCKCCCHYGGIIDTRVECRYFPS